MGNAAIMRTVMAKIGVTMYPPNMPQWAQDLVDQVCDDYEINPPSVTWIQKSRKLSQGRAWNYENEYRLVMSVGTDENDAKLILLHEIAHLIRPTKDHHSEEFWLQAFALYRRYGINMRYAYDREKTYRGMARTIGAEYLAGIW